MSFGYSVGDFIQGANMSYRLIKALSETRGASIEYQEAILELGSLQQTFLQVGQMHPNQALDRATINAAACIVLSSMTLIGKFLKRTEGYRKKLAGSTSSAKLSDSWQKMGWVLFQKEELKMLKNELHVRLTHIGVLLSAAQFHAKIPMPRSVSQFEDTSMGSSSDPMNHEVHTSLPSPAYSSIAGIGTATLEKSPTPCLTINVKLMGALKQLDSECGLEALKDSKLGERGLEIRESPSNSKFSRLSAEKLPFTIPDNNTTSIHFSGSPQDNESEQEHIRLPQQQTVLPSRVDLFLQLEALLKQHGNIQDHTSARTQSSGANLISQLEALLKQTGSLPKGKLKPIKFKDAVGRKFIFPFEKCSTWDGMAELIGQAFFYVEGLGPHVAEGHYDLLGPTGAVILPRVWEDMIQPDWAISMHMWPMPEPPRPHRHRSISVSDPMGGPSQNGRPSGAPSIRPIGHPFLPPAPHTSTKSDLASPLTNFEHSSHFTGGPSKQNLGPAPPYVDSKPPFEPGTSHTNLSQSASAISNTPPSSIRPRKPNKPSKGEQQQDMELPELEKKECDVSSDWELTATTLSRRTLRKEKKQERKARSAANRQ